MSIARFFPAPWTRQYQRAKGVCSPKISELSRGLFWLIAARAAILIPGLTLARALGLLPERIGSFPFTIFFHSISAALTIGYLAWRSSGRRLGLQLRIQIVLDLLLTTLLVSQTGGFQSAFVSFYLLIIIYCSLMLGRNGGLIGAASSTILYSGVLATDRLMQNAGTQGDFSAVTFRVCLNALGFFAVAALGASLSHRLRTVQEELEEKVGSLEQLQSLNEHIVASIRSGLITTDLAGRITLFNRAAQELLARNEAVGQHIRSVGGGTLWGRVITTDLAGDPRPLRHEDWVELPDGKRKYLGFSVSPLMNQERDSIGYIVSFQDLTEIKRLEEEVRIRDRMAAVGRMAAGIAHEIRNPLMAMRGSVEILHSRLHLPLGDSRLLDILLRESDRLNGFVEEFLHFAKPDDYTLGPVDLSALLRDWTALAENSPEFRRKHAVRLEVPSGEIRIRGNADKLKQVFWNLAQNALRAMPAGGPLTITARRTAEGGGEIVFRDEGIGMSQEERSRLFQPFHGSFQGGTGLGLSIIFQIVEDHQGRIRFESEKGRGTSVILSFPPETGRLGS